MAVAGEGVEHGVELGNDRLADVVHSGRGSHCGYMPGVAIGNDGPLRPLQQICVPIGVPRTLARCGKYNRSHIPPVLAADFEHGRGDLAQRATAHRIHEYREYVLVCDHGLLEARERGLGVLGITFLKLT